MVGESCGMGGGICDKCGCEFITPLLQDHYCPNCGSKRWNVGIQNDRDKEIARVQDTQPWIMEKTNKGGTKAYRYWMASWRKPDGKIHHEYLGSCKKFGDEAARQLAMSRKAAALGIEW